MSKTIAIMSNKGGDGKTTTCLNLAYGLATSGKKVLVIDLDPQANSTSILVGEKSDPQPADHSANEFLEAAKGFKCHGADNFSAAYLALEDYVHKFQSHNEVFDLFTEQCTALQAINKTRIEGLDIIPSSCRLASVDLFLKNKLYGGLYVLRKALLPVQKEYDYILLDNGPMENALTMNALAACNKNGDLIIVPTKIDRAGLEGTYATLHACYELAENEDLPFDVKILITMKNRNGVDEAWKNALMSVSDDFCFKSVIRYQAKPISDSSLKYQFVTEKFPNSPVAQDYKAFINEILAIE